MKNSIFYLLFAFTILIGCKNNSQQEKNHKENQTFVDANDNAKVNLSLSKDSETKTLYKLLALRKHISGRINGQPPASVNLNIKNTSNQNQNFPFLEVDLDITGRKITKFYFFDEKSLLRIGQVLDFKHQQIKTNTNTWINEAIVLRDPDLPLHNNSLTLCKGWKIKSITPVNSITVILDDHKGASQSISIPYTKLELTKGSSPQKTFNVHYRNKAIKSLFVGDVIYSGLPDFIENEVSKIELLWFGSSQFHHNPGKLNHAQTLSSFNCP